MRIGINALYAMRSRVGGMETYTMNLLENLSKIDQKNQYTIFEGKGNFGKYNFPTGNFSEIRLPVSNGLSPFKFLYEQIFLPLQVNKNKINLFFSPAYILPIALSCPSVVTIHCITYKRSPSDFD